MRPGPWITRRITPRNINYDYGQGYESADPYGYDYGQDWTATEYADPNEDYGCEENDRQGGFDPRSKG